MLVYVVFVYVGDYFVYVVVGVYVEVCVDDLVCVV